jgi:hypothetical protein
VVKERGGSDPTSANWGNVLPTVTGGGIINQGEFFQIGIGINDANAPTEESFNLGFRMGDPQSNKGTDNGASFNCQYFAGNNPYWQFSGFNRNDITISIEITN